MTETVNWLSKQLVKHFLSTNCLLHSSFQLQRTEKWHILAQKTTSRRKAPRNQSHYTHEYHTGYFLGLMWAWQLLVSSCQKHINICPLWSCQRRDSWFMSHAGVAFPHLQTNTLVWHYELKCEIDFKKNYSSSEWKYAALLRSTEPSSEDDLTWKYSSRSVKLDPVIVFPLRADCLSSRLTRRNTN